MSDVNSLTELAGFIAKSPLAARDTGKRQAALAALEANMLPKPRKSSDLLGTVLALSARTRRIVQPKTHVEIDVFCPGNARAVVLKLSQGT